MPEGVVTAMRLTAQQEATLEAMNVLVQALMDGAGMTRQEATQHLRWATYVLATERREVTT